MRLRCNKNQHEIMFQRRTHDTWFISQRSHNELDKLNRSFYSSKVKEKYPPLCIFSGHRRVRKLNVSVRGSDESVETTELAVNLKHIRVR